MTGWEVARVAGTLLMLGGVVVLYRSMRSLRITVTALRATCERLAARVDAGAQVDQDDAR